MRQSGGQEPQQRAQHRKRACTRRVENRHRVDRMLGPSSVFQAVPLVQPLASVGFRRMKINQSFEPKLGD
jgi:hypothetical protein